MSTQDAATGHEEDHTGPIKTPSQVLWVSLASLVIPIFVIIALVYYVVSGNKPAAGAIEVEKATLMRIAKVGSVEIRDANRPLKSGLEVYNANCASCHAAGAAGAPKFGDVSAWGARIKTGYDALLNSSLKGKGAMGAQGGGDFDDVEIGRAVVHLTNAAGAKFAVPERAVATAVAVVADDAAGKAAAAQVAAVVATAAPVMVAAVAAHPGEALYKQACVACHASGAGGAPKTGDKAAWAPRVGLGVAALTASVIKGKGAMPPKGMAMSSTDAEIKASVEYLLAQIK